MKRYESDRFRAMGMDGHSYLATSDLPLDELKAEIDKANAKAVKLGYKAEQFIITHTEYYRYEDDNGMFVKHEVYETAVEIYPKSL